MIKHCYILEVNRNLHSSAAYLFMNDKCTVQIQREITKHLDDHYEVGLLWASDDVVLPDNRAMVVVCIKHLGKHLRNSFELEVTVNSITYWIDGVADRNVGIHFTFEIGSSSLLDDPWHCLLAPDFNILYAYH